MKIKEKRKFKLILFGTITLIMIIVVAIIVYNMNIKTNNETISAKSSTSNIGITSESTANSWDTSKLSEVIVDTSMVDSETGEVITMYVPIPSGYTASKATSEDTVIEGLVIYEGEEVVTDSNVDEAKTTRNQYVWIPVDPKDVYWTDENGENWGIEYDFTSTGRTANKSMTEPRFGELGGSDYKLDSSGSDIESSLELNSDMQKYFNEMIKSIELYGGFFIGRYELGDNELTTRSAESGYTSTPVEMQGKYVYNFISGGKAYDLCKTLSGTNENIRTCMIYGCLWDATLEFLVETGNKTYDDLIDSTSWGNYFESTFTYTNISGETVTKPESYTQQNVIPTGSTEYTKACNIYDLAGNAWEYTQESWSTILYYFSNSITKRAGNNMYSYKSEGSASNRTSCSFSGTGGIRHTSSRAILYIN